MPGGAYHNLSERALAQLQLRARDFPLDDFKRAVGVYSIERLQEPQSAGASRDRLNEISGAARQLYDLIIAADNASEILGVECALHGDTTLPLRIQPMLLRLAGLSDNARDEAAGRVSAGRDYSPRTRLVGALQRALERVGITATASANGLLVVAFDIALEDLGESAADPSDTVRKALASLRRNK